MGKGVNLGEKDSELIQKIENFKKHRNFPHLLKRFAFYATMDYKQMSSKKMSNKLNSCFGEGGQLMKRKLLYAIIIISVIYIFSYNNTSVAVEQTPVEFVNSGIDTVIAVGINANIKTAADSIITNAIDATTTITPKTNK